MTISLFALGVIVTIGATVLCLGLFTPLMTLFVCLVPLQLSICAVVHSMRQYMIFKQDLKNIKTAPLSETAPLSDQKFCQNFFEKKGPYFKPSESVLFIMAKRWGAIALQAADSNNHSWCITSNVALTALINGLEVNKFPTLLNDTKNALKIKLSRCAQYIFDNDKNNQKTWNLSAPQEAVDMLQHLRRLLNPTIRACENIGLHKDIMNIVLSYTEDNPEEYVYNKILNIANGKWTPSKETNTPKVL